MELLKDFQIKYIVISEDFKNTTPADRKLQRKEDYFINTGKLPEDIVINDDNVLIDGYSTYLVAVKYGILSANVKRGYVELIEAAHSEGSRLYAWRVPAFMHGSIKKGDRCIVRTGNGVKRVVVVNILRQQYPVQNPRLRNVIRLERKV